MERTFGESFKRRFRLSWRGYNTREVDVFLDEVMADLNKLKAHNAALQREVQDLAKEVSEHREREKAIRNVLTSVQKASEIMKANAEKEAKLIIADAELRAEKILQSAHQRLAELHRDINELKRQRIQLEAKLRSTIETYRQLLEAQREDEPAEEGLDTKVALLNR
ncbi:DivIVA domain-containing protein [Desulfosoma caldarium]|uniref:Cell division initiation protein n=1 Tax=Desulfosoma caldarium TaxID=610254 RepID=A0A3N1VNG5_9BACT|nr:DivIVA domain-containing protein [Desulfosoma caldarium]ROR01752.1 cell division initiation protein [Desulfosoma caldarium]